MARHKDHALMALMWSLDPALHRLSMWLARLCMLSSDPSPDPDSLLTYGKLPANALLVLIFGCMLVAARRATPVMVFNVGMQLALFTFGLASLLASAATRSEPGPRVWATALVGGTVLALSVVALVAVSLRRGKRLDNHINALSRSTTHLGQP